MPRESPYIFYLQVPKSSKQAIFNSKWSVPIVAEYLWAKKSLAILATAPFSMLESKLPRVSNMFSLEITQFWMTWSSGEWNDSPPEKFGLRIICSMLKCVIPGSQNNAKYNLMDRNNLILILINNAWIIVEWTRNLINNRDIMSLAIGDCRISRSGRPLMATTEQPKDAT